MSENNNRNGYEIRQGLLQQAQRIVEQNAHMAFETSDKKDWKPVTTEQVIEVAEKENVEVTKVCPEIHYTSPKTVSNSFTTVFNPTDNISLESQ